MVSDVGESECASFTHTFVDSMKPFVGKRFPSVDEAVKFYRCYAAVCGFDVRLSTLRTHTDGTNLQRYGLCNREGMKEVGDEYKRKRSRRSCRTSYMTRVVIKFIGNDGYCFSTFNEEHSHPLVKEDYKQFMKSQRRFDPAHKSFALNCLRAGILANKSYSLFKGFVGGHANVGCSKVDFKNFCRDLRSSVSGVDAQIVLESLERRQSISPGFVFNYEVDNNNKLIRLFWCDQTSTNFYKIFGDVVSFDATYTTNKYNMVFTPFTGCDNNGKCVTFGAGLLNHEDFLSYTWLLEKFRQAMDNKIPSVIITDQDPAVRIAIQNVFPPPTCRHHFCMWHIMLKLPDKLSTAIIGDESFLQRFHDIVWANNMSPDVFETKWTEIMTDFGLLGHKWFSDKYDLRSFWVPAFFRDYHMGGLFRTTSFSESQNHMFQKYLNKNSNLLEFFMRFGIAIDFQRHEYIQANSADSSSSPVWLTTHPIEKHMASVYTFYAFKKVQRELFATQNDCQMRRMLENLPICIYDVEDTIFGDVVTVTFNTSEESFSCGCHYFVRKGLVCRHLLYVFKNRKLERIPHKYLVRRWTKLASIDVGFPPTIHGQLTSVRGQVFSQVYKCVDVVDGDTDLLNKLLLDLKMLTEKYAAEKEARSEYTNKEAFEDFYGGSVPDSVSILSLSPVKTKGSGSRLKSRVEKAILTAKKPKRKCAKCKKLVNHDSRNCPMQNTEE